MTRGSLYLLIEVLIVYPQFYTIESVYNLFIQRYNCYKCTYLKKNYLKGTDKPVS